MKILTIAALALTCLGSQVGAVERPADPDINCLAEAIYHEARSVKLSDQSRRNVAWVILNRAKSKHWPGTLCGVVRQANRDSNGKLIKYQCAFTYYCDGASDRISEVAAWNNAVDIATSVVDADIAGDADPTKGSDHYHTRKVNPRWAVASKITVKSDPAHLFYKLY